MTREQSLSISIEDKEGVVDTDTESDHRGERRGERRNVKEACHNEDQHLPDDKTEDGDHDGHAGGHDGAKGDEQNDDGDQDPDGLTGRWRGSRVVQDLTAGSDLQRVGVGCFDGVDHGDGIRG